MDHIDCAVGDGPQLFEHEVVLACERYEDRAHHLSGLARTLLAADLAELGDPLGEVARAQQIRMVWIHQRDVVSLDCRECLQLAVVEREPPPLPRAAALLDEPKAHDVAQQPGRSVDSSLVRQVRCGRRGIEDRRLRLDAEQRPGSGGQDRCGWTRHRRGDEGRRGVMRGDRPDRRPGDLVEVRT